MASEERGERLVDAPVLTFKIPEQAEKLKNESQWREEDRNGITLQKNDYLCTVLIALKKGAKLVRHELEGPSTWQVISGSVAIEAEDVRYELGAESMTIFERRLRHLIEALEESVILLTVVYDRTEVQ